MSRKSEGVEEWVEDIMDALQSCKAIGDGRLLVRRQEAIFGVEFCDQLWRVIRQCEAKPTQKPTHGAFGFLFGAL
jgi:hypothetical protein